MGVVYQAYNLKRQQMVALKTLQRMEGSALFRLKQEFHILTEISHPNLVALYHLFSKDTQWFLAMELVDGDHFLRYVRSGVGACRLSDGRSRSAAKGRNPGPLA